MVKDIAWQQDLSLAITQHTLTELEITAANDARAAAKSHGVSENNILVVDGPLRDRAHLVRALGYNKTHHAQYLPPDLNAMVAALGTAERTPIFAIATGWSRYSWYLRLPCLPSGAWTGIVRLEAALTLDLTEAVALADASQKLLGRFASVEYKDAPLQLHPGSGAPQTRVPATGMSRWRGERFPEELIDTAGTIYRADKSESAYVPMSSD